MDTKQLKQRILDLAIRGKLVPQDPNDEPASVLLERIRTEKEQLIAQGKLKKSKTKTSDKPHYENVPFEIPESWEWVTLDFVCSKIGSGSTPKGSNYSESGIPFFRSQNVYNDGLVFEDIKYISEQVHQSMIGTEVKANDLLLNITGGSLGRCAIVPLNFTQGNVSQHVCILRPIVVLSQYIHAFILSAFFAKTMKITGSGREGLPKYNLEKMIFPIPPLAEQQRIVAEVEKWFALIDELEVNKEDLTEYIKQVKSKVLDLAIHGKLVPQDPNDEPAIELLKRINPNFKPCDTSHYENLPNGWTVCSIKDISKTISSRQYQVLQSDICKEGIFPVVSQSANYIEGYCNLKDKVLEHKQPVIVFGDHTRVVKYIDFDFIVGADGVKILSPMIDSKYFYYLILNGSENIKNRGYGRHFGLLSKEEYFIPPLKEQHRIVSLLETIEKQLDTISAEL